MTGFQIYPETELACKYTKTFYKTQYSKILVEYEQGFDMNTGKLIIHPMAKSHSTTDENSSDPVKFFKNTGNVGGKSNHKTKTVHVTKTITNEQHSFWRNSLRHTTSYEIRLYNK